MCYWKHLGILALTTVKAKILLAVLEARRKRKKKEEEGEAQEEGKEEEKEIGGRCYRLTNQSQGPGIPKQQTLHGLSLHANSKHPDQVHSWYFNQWLPTHIRYNQSEFSFIQQNLFEQELRS